MFSFYLYSISSLNYKNLRPFPVLPIHKDDGDEYDAVGVDENDQNADNQQHYVVGLKSLPPMRAPPSTKKNQSNCKQTPPPPTVTASPCVFSSLFKPKSSRNTPPSENACRKRLAQISHELRKASSMMHHTQNKSVQHACTQRIVDLQNERRLYQIIQERIKIQSMMMSTNVESVRAACSERLKQLVLEFDHLQHAEGGEDSAEHNFEERVPSSPSSCTYNYDARGEEERDNSSRWYDRVLRYVHGPTDDDERVQKDDGAASYFANGQQPHYQSSPETTTTATHYDNHGGQPWARTIRAAQERKLYQVGTDGIQ